MTDEPIYVWQVYIPAKIEYRLYQACILIGLDIYDEWEVQFDGYTKLAKGVRPDLYASVVITCTDDTAVALMHKLKDLGVTDTDMWILDELEQEIEEENEQWQNQ